MTKGEPANPAGGQVGKGTQTQSGCRRKGRRIVKLQSIRGSRAATAADHGS